MMSLARAAGVVALAGSAAIAIPAPSNPPAAPSNLITGGPLGNFGRVYADTAATISISKRLGTAVTDAVATVSQNAISNDAPIAQNGLWNPANNPE